MGGVGRGSAWVWCVSGCEIEVDQHGWGWLWVDVGLVRWWLRDRSGSVWVVGRRGSDALVVVRSKWIGVGGVGRGLAWVWCVGGCEIGLDRHGWCWPWVIGFGRRYGWCWVCLLMGWVCLLSPVGDGFTCRGWCWVCFFLFFLFLVMLGLMSVGVVGFVIDGGGGGD